MTVSRFRIAELVHEHYKNAGRGMTRRELADAIGWKQTKNLPGVRQAISEGMIRYDGNELVPVRR